MKDAPTTKTKTLLLLDSHAIIHRAYHAVPNLQNSKGVPTGALFGIINMLFGILERFKPDAIIACYDLPHPTYRHEVYEAYKGNRAKSDDALVAQIISSRKIFEALCIPMFDKPGFEADDILGTIVERSVKEFPDYRIIIASGDMDTMQLVSGNDVIVYTLRKGITDTVTYNEEAVNLKYGFGPLQLIDFKGLRGDASDNIIGVPGVGEKTATTIIQEFGNIENLYEYLEEIKEFTKGDERLKKAGISERFFKILTEHKDDAIFSKALATIRRDAPFDLNFEQIKPWYECVDPKAFDALIDEYELKSIRGKLDRVIQIQTGNKPVKVKDDMWHELVAISDAADGSSKTPKEKPVLKEITEEDKIKTWLLRSYISEPEQKDVEDLLGNGKDTLDDLLKKEGVLELYEKVEKPIIYILKEMHERGIKIDLAYFKKLGKEYREYLENLQKEIWELTGEEFNISSPKQMATVLYDKLDIVKGSGARIKKTAGGARSTKESELEKLVDAHPAVPKILEFREYSKLLGTYIEPFPLLADDNDRLHPNYLQTGAVTGRIACENPSIQNIPIKTALGRAIRNGFVAKEGSILVTIDYSQVELRIAAILSKDKELIEIFTNGEDIHTGVAARMYKVDVADVTPEMRRHAKTINFGILYGMGVQALAKGLGVKQTEAQDFYLNYYSTFSGLAKYLQDCKIQAERKGYTETLFKRRRYFPEIKSPISFIKAAAERMAINAPIQGTNADMVKMAMVNIDAWIKKNNLSDKIGIVAQVHDELIFEMDNSNLKFVDESIKHIRGVMERILDSIGEDKVVPIETSVKKGLSWGGAQ
ncbi:MAG: DNA polymerase [Patescibacteria group bacterium]